MYNTAIYKIVHSDQFYSGSQIENANIPYINIKQQVATILFPKINGGMWSAYVLSPPQ